MGPRSWRHDPPSWWPAGEPWPPRRRARLRHRGGLFILPFLAVFFIVFAVVLASLFFLVIAGLLALRSEGPRLPIPLGLRGPWIAGLVILLCCALIPIIRMIRRITVPFGQLVEAAGRIAEGDYSARVAERGTLEVRTLARAFNTMAARLQAHDEQRRSLLADITHELRTPLTVVQGNLEGMVDGIYPLDREHLEPVLEETRQLSRLIEDLRTLALAESGALKLQREPADLATLASETAASFRPQAERAGVELQVQAGADLPPASVDAARIREVLDNLIANALRYTPRGGRIRVECAANGSAPRQVAVAVSDTGQGIAAEDLPHVFDRFYKSRDSRGSGLGLAIARDLVRAHGGDMTAESAPGQGTTVRFWLPAQT